MFDVDGGEKSKLLTLDSGTEKMNWLEQKREMSFQFSQFYATPETANTKKNRKFSMNGEEEKEWMRLKQ